MNAPATCHSVAWARPTLARLAIVELALEDFSERHVEEAVETPDGIELPHVDVAVGYAQAGSTWKYTTSPSYKRVAVLGRAQSPG